MKYSKKETKTRTVACKNNSRKYEVQCPKCTYRISKDLLSNLVSSIKEHMSGEHNIIIEDSRKRTQPCANLLQEKEGNAEILGWSLVECPLPNIELKPCRIGNCGHVIRPKSVETGLYRTEQDAFAALRSHLANNHAGSSIKSKNFYKNLNLYINYIEKSTGEKRKAENQDIEGDKESLNLNKIQKTEDLKDHNSLFPDLPPLDIEVVLDNCYNWGELNND